MAFTERSAKARTAILEAAARRFATDGYEKATIRAIATDAGVDPAMVIRYFTSKADLFYASAWTDLPHIDVTGTQDFAGRYAEIFVDLWESGNVAMAALLRSSPTHPDVAETLQGVLNRQFMPVFREAFPDRPDIDKRAGLVLSQTIGMAYCRYLLKLEPVASMSRDEIEAAIAASIRHFLTES
jgi:AcrR family transcriptional regulator